MTITMQFAVRHTHADESRRRHTARARPAADMMPPSILDISSAMARRYYAHYAPCRANAFSIAYTTLR